tara:strand:- start:135 stop:281 length:147 start_codon:yes stop_codon:yes gene_type:complete
MKQTIPFRDEKPVEYPKAIHKLARDLECTPKEADDMMRRYGLRFKDKS